MRTNFLLIDFENVQPKNVGLLNGGHFKVRVFLGANQTKVPVEMARSLQVLGPDAEYIQVSDAGRNALDFHIAYYLGRLAMEHPGSFFHIVSKDAGFDPLIKHLRSQKVFCQRSPSIDGIPLVRLVNSKSIPDKVDAIVENLTRRTTGRPKTVKSLGSTIEGLFQGQLSEEDLGSILGQLSKRHVIQIVDGRVTYHLPSGVE